MSRRANLVNFAVAAATGVASGIYIFKPLITNNTDNSTAHQNPPDKTAQERNLAAAPEKPKLDSDASPRSPTNI